MSLNLVHLGVRLYIQFPPVAMSIMMAHHNQRKYAKTAVMIPTAGSYVCVCVCLLCVCVLFVCVCVCISCVRCVLYVYCVCIMCMCVYHVHVCVLCMCVYCACIVYCMCMYVCVYQFSTSQHMYVYNYAEQPCMH